MNEERALEYAGRVALVTGASGFIGAHLCAILRQMGATVHTTSRVAETSDSSAHQHQIDLCEPTNVQALFARVRPEYVFHLAGDSRGARGTEMVLPTLHTNLVATANVLLASTEHRVSRVVLAGSLEEPPDDSGPLIPSSPYAASKLAGSQYARMFHALYGTHAIVARIYMVYGPGQRDLHKLIPYVIVSLLRGGQPQLTSGSRAVDWVYVEDVALGLARAALRDDLDGRTFDVGTGVLTTVADVARCLRELAAPGGIAPQLGAVAERPLEQVRIADPAQLEALLAPWRMTPLLDGLTRSVAWYRARIEAGELNLSTLGLA